MGTNRIQVASNFYLDEFECPCCHGVFQLDGSLLDILQTLRDRINEGELPPVSVIVTSGCRCIAHQKAIYRAKGKEPNLGSGHLFGKAVDIKLIRGGHRLLWFNKYLDVAKELFNGVGTTVSRRWIHVDVKDRKSEWTYTNE